MAPKGSGVAIIAIDFGTSRCKVGAFDLEGNVLRAGIAENRMKKGREGHYEQDAEEFRRTLAGCLRSVVPRIKSRVGIVSVTGQGSAPVCLDGRGRPVFPVLSHLDARAAEQREKLYSRFGSMGYTESKVFSNLLWLRENSGSHFSRISTVLDIREYVGFLLTGRPTYDSRGTSKEGLGRLAGYVGLNTSAFGVPHDYWKPIGHVSGDAAKVFGLPGDVPVIQGPGDTLCAAIGAGISVEGRVCDVAGSTEVVAACAPHGVKSDGRLYPIPHIVKGRSFLFMSPPLGMIFNWFADLLYGDVAVSRRYRLMEREASRTSPAEDGPMFVPFVRRFGHSYKIESGFFNLNASHDRGEIARSAMEGIAFTVKSALERMRRLRVKVSEVRVGGGGARSPLWNQIKADAFGVDVVQTQTLETSCLGAAMVAAVAAGEYGNIAEAEGMMVRPVKRFSPRESARALYERMYSSFSRRLAALEAS